jgi:Protein of unknown function (DUF1592)/Protein of unknown function (DUF1588)/Protein of unknown function (DUF1595)/Protein of unknown function (DUF1585)/Protein of unknown function (DUF1587)
MRRHKTLYCTGLALCTLVAVACTGAVGSGGPDNSGSAGPSGPGGGAGGSSGGMGPGGSGAGGPGAGAGGGAGGSGAASGAGAVSIAPLDGVTQGSPMVLRHLTQQEYLNTVRDLLSDTSVQAINVPAELPIGEFDTYAFPQPATVGTTEARAYQTLAATLATNVTSKLSTILTCTPTVGNTMSESACVTTFLNTFGTRAYRRPLTATEISGLQALYQTGRGTLGLDFNGAIALLVEEMLQSPGFLYHWEEGPSPTVHDGTMVQLDPYAIANRLAFFLTSTMPDQTLLAAAAAGQLSTAADVTAQAQRLLKDPSGHASAAVQNFFAQLLQITNLSSVPKDATVYPNWTPALQTAMDTEFRTFFSTNILNGTGLFSDLFTSKKTVANQALAAVYGLSGVGGTQLQSVTLDANRSGFLTMPAFLAVNGNSNDSHAIYRGHAVYMQLLCHALTPPQNVVVPVPPAATPGETSRQRFSAHSQAACAQGCHNLMDPYGFAMEHFDGIGQYRTTDNGSPVDSTTTITLDKTTHAVGDAIELSNLMSTSQEARQCFAAQWVRYAISRPDTADDAPSINDAYAAFSSANYNVNSLLVGVASSRTFRYRTPAAGEMLP